MTKLTNKTNIWEDVYNFDTIWDQCGKSSISKELNGSLAIVLNTSIYIILNFFRFTGRKGNI